MRRYGDMEMWKGAREEHYDDRKLSAERDLGNSFGSAL